MQPKQVRIKHMDQGFGNELKEWVKNDLEKIDDVGIDEGSET